MSKSNPGTWACGNAAGPAPWFLFSRALAPALALRACPQTMQCCGPGTWDHTLRTTAPLTTQEIQDGVFLTFVREE